MLRSLSAFLVLALAASAASASQLAAANRRERVDLSLLKEANFQVAAAQASYQGAQQSLLLRVSQAYFGILSAADQLSTNRGERDAFATLLNREGGGLSVALELPAGPLE